MTVHTDTYQYILTCAKSLKVCTRGRYFTVTVLLLSIAVHGGTWQYMQNSITAYGSTWWYMALYFAVYDSMAALHFAVYHGHGLWQYMAVQGLDFNTERGRLFPRPIFVCF